jgi:hypothetical protein
MLTGFLLVSCSHVRADAETVAEHRNDAAIHTAKARAADSESSPMRRPAPRLPGSSMFGQEQVGLEAYNPTDAKAEEADREFAAANAHLAAARKLLAFEAQACRGLSEAERSACPLLAGSVERVEPNAKGFVLAFKPAADLEGTYRRLRCHLAYAEATGFDAPSCPLFMRGLNLSKASRGLIFAGDDEQTSAALRNAAFAAFGSKIDPQK